MPPITKSDVRKQDFIVVKEKNNIDIARIVAPHELQVGIDGFKGSSLRVAGGGYIVGSLEVVGGVKGALKLPDGTLALKAGAGVKVTDSGGGTVTLSLGSSTGGIESLIKPGDGMMASTSNGVVTLSLNRETTLPHFVEGTGVKISRLANSYTFALDADYIANRQSGVTTVSGSGLTAVSDPAGLLSLSIDPNYLPSKIIQGSGITISNSSGQLTISAASGSGETVFQNDIIVSLSGGKTFGRYVSGDTIPATGKTASEVLTLATVEPIDPTVSLTSSTTIAFNQTNISNVINFSHTINSLSATVSTATLEWRRGNSGGWTVLESGLTASGAFTHSLTDTSFNSLVFNYRYIVTDSVGAATTTTLNVTPASYVAPSISLNVVGATLNSIETSLKRERGNVSSNLSGAITRNSPMVNLLSYVLQYSIDGTSWVDINQAPVSIGPGTHNMTLLNHNNLELKTRSSIRYRASVIDTYQQHLNSYGVTGGLTIVSFLNLMLFGSVGQAPQSSNDVRALPGKIFTDGSNPFTISTGTINRVFSFAVPSGTGLVSVVDVDALNANITTSYVKSTLNVLDFGGTATSYDIYIMTNAEPYGPNSHTHQVTRT